MNSGEWINHRGEDLRKQFTGKTITVSGDKVVKTFGDAVDTLTINKIVKKTTSKELELYAST